MVSNNDKQKKKQNRIEYANSDIKIFPNEEKSQKIIVKEEEQVKLPKDEEICNKCFYTNGKMYYCISIHKIKYVFDKKGNFKEQIKLSDDEFASIMREDGVDPDNFIVDTTISE